MSFFRGALSALVLVIGAFALWSVQVPQGTGSLGTPGHPCGPEAGPCRTPLGSYSARLPLGAKAGGPPVPAVMFLHGGGADGAAFVRDGPLARRVAARGWVLLAPDTAAGPGSWHLSTDPRRSSGRAEGRFLDAVIQDAGERLAVDPARVFLLGFSRGGMLVSELACLRPNLGRASASVAGGFLGSGPARCLGPVAFLHLHGETDLRVPFDGQEGPRPMLAVPDGAAKLAAASGCGGPRPEQPVSDRGLRQRWAECVPGARVEIVRLPGGHALTTRMIDLALDHFADHL